MGFLSVTQCNFCLVLFDVLLLLDTYKIIKGSISCVCVCVYYVCICVFICTESSTFPRIRPYPRMDSSNSACSAQDRKPAIARRVLGEDLTLDLSSGDNKNCLLLTQQSADVNLEENRRASNEKARQRALTCVAESQTGRISRKLDKATKLPLLQNDLDREIEKRTITTRREGDDTKESIYE